MLAERTISLQWPVALLTLSTWNRRRTSAHTKYSYKASKARNDDFSKTPDLHKFLLHTQKNSWNINAYELEFPTNREDFLQFLVNNLEGTLGPVANLTVSLLICTFDTIKIT